jgi:transcriptional regulator with XRE-family HTH domain
MAKIDAKIREILRVTGWKQYQFATHLGVSQSTVNRWLTGSEPEGHRRDQINDLYAEIVQGSASDLPIRTVPLKGYVGAGQFVEAIDNGTLDEVDAPANAAPETVAAIVRGESMLPVFQDGWTIFWSKQLPPGEMINELCVMQLSNGQILVKTLRPGSRPGRFTLTSTNASDMLDQEVDWVAPIDWVKPTRNAKTLTRPNTQ